MCNDTEMKNLKKAVMRLRQQLAQSMMPGACGGPQACPPDLVAPDTAALIRGGNRTTRLSLAGLTGLAAGASVTVSIPPNGLERTIVLSDLISSLASLDNISITAAASGVEKFSLNGGVFSRGNANACTTSCGYGVCLGPVETLTLTVVNQTTAAFAAGTSGTLSAQSIYRGEPGFLCTDCIPAGSAADPNYGFDPVT